MACLAVLVAVAGCTSGDRPPQPDRPAVSVLPGGTTTPAPTTPTPTTSIPTTSATTTVGRPSATSTGQQIEGPCPYLSADEARTYEGDRVGNVFRLSGDPVGCRFYFEYDESRIVLQITLRRFASTNAALDYLIQLTRTHPEYVTDKNIGEGAVAVRADLQGIPTWQCSFVKDEYVVTVHTRQSNPSYDARHLAELIQNRVFR